MEITTALTVINTLLPFLTNAVGKAMEKINLELLEEIKKKFSEKGRDKELIEIFISNPDDIKLQAIVEYRLEQCIREDHNFANKLQVLLNNLPNPETSNIQIQKIASDSNFIIQNICGASIATNKK